MERTVDNSGADSFISVLTKLSKFGRFRGAVGQLGLFNMLGPIAALSGTASGILASVKKRAYGMFQRQHDDPTNQHVSVKRIKTTADVGPLVTCRRHPFDLFHDPKGTQNYSLVWADDITKCIGEAQLLAARDALRDAARGEQEPHSPAKTTLAVVRNIYFDNMFLHEYQKGMSCVKPNPRIIEAETQDGQETDSEEIRTALDTALVFLSRGLAEDCCPVSDLTALALMADISALLYGDVPPSLIELEVQILPTPLHLPGSIQEVKTDDGMALHDVSAPSTPTDDLNKPPGFVGDWISFASDAASYVATGSLVHNKNLASILKTRKNRSLQTPKRLQNSRQLKTVKFASPLVRGKPTSRRPGHLRIQDGAAAAGVLHSTFPVPGQKRQASTKYLQMWSDQLEPLPISEEKRDEIRLILSQRERAALEAKRKAEEEREEKRRREEAEKRRKQQELEDRLRRLKNEARFGLREPNAPVIGALPESELISRAKNTLNIHDDVEVSQTVKGNPLVAKDFKSLIPPTQWLNDGAVNGALEYLVDYINKQEGRDSKSNPKVLMLGSLFWKYITGPTSKKATWARSAGRQGVKADFFMKTETILIPICEGNHWTLAVIRPRLKTFSHLDSLRRGGLVSVTDTLRGLTQQILKEKFVSSEWEVVDIPSTRQHNGYDCGVHTITNAICFACGVKPTYDTSRLPDQRLTLAAVLLKKGFEGVYDLSRL